MVVSSSVGQFHITIGILGSRLNLQPIATFIGRTVAGADDDRETLFVIGYTGIDPAGGTAATELRSVQGNHGICVYLRLGEVLHARFNLTAPLRNVHRYACLQSPLLTITIGTAIAAIRISAARESVMIRFFTGILVDYFHCSADFLLGLSDEPHYEENYLPTPPFKDSFRAALGENKTTQYAVQKKSNISWANFHYWLNGIRLPYLDSLIKLANAMDCSIDCLLGRVK